jgi:transposase-like protein
MAENGRQRRSAQTWGELIKQQKASGLSVPAFCRREGLSPWTLYGWRSRLRSGKARRPKRLPAPAQNATSFIDLGALRAPATERWEIRLDLGGGIVLQLAHG